MMNFLAWTFPDNIKLEILPSLILPAHITQLLSSRDDSTMNISDLARQHVPQITTTVLLVTYALARKKLTPGGVTIAVVIAIIHMAHPWPAFFWLPIAFFFLGTFVTKVSALGFVYFIIITRSLPQPYF